MTDRLLSSVAEEALDGIRVIFTDGVEKVEQAGREHRANGYEHFMVDVPEGARGSWCVEHYTITPEEETLQKIRCAFNPQRDARFVPAGIYTRLCRNGAVIMSDTPDEIRDHMKPIRRACGDCLVNGLGLGVVVGAMLAKEEVRHVTAVEYSEDVIALVAPHYQERYGDRLTVVHADALTWKAPKGMQFCVVWSDIWDDISAGNLPEMTKLKRRYGRRSVWQGCWQEDGCRAQQRRVKSGRGWY